MNQQRNLDAIEYVSKHSDFVRINQDKLQEFAASYRAEHVTHWSSRAPFDLSKLDAKQRLNFLVFIDALAFCYWGEPKWTLEYSGQIADGFYGTILALERAVAKNSGILDFEYLAKISAPDFAEIFKANVEIPLLAERYAIIREISNKIVQNYEGDFENVLRAGDFDALKLLDLLAQEFPNFTDVAEYKGQTIQFMKRASLLLNDLPLMFGDQGPGAIKNIDQLLGRADYKIPQSMRKLGILEYVPELVQKIDGKIELPSKSPEEIEIRANMIWALELCRRILEPKIPGITRSAIDDSLWLAGQIKSPDDKPYHRTRTTDY